ncbi:MAG: thioredoxin family protein [Cyclobacteriaceae bacterium]|nr:TM0996/MTH895 family glutaredoxin-like protein [Cyclobacteriaceae bacterium]MCH8517934.1 thioredoxin family protein [Cyclobacteriaceae bacterium]
MMKTIKVLGTGCPKCKKTVAAAEEAIQKYGLDAQVEKVEDIEAIMAYQVLSTPAVVVDEVVKLKGRVPSAEQIRDLIA